MTGEGFSRRLAVLAGLLYLLIILAGVGAELLVRGAVVVPGDAAATAARIVENSGLFRAGFAAEAAMAAADAALAVLLYRMLAPAGAVMSLTAMVFRLIQSAILAMNLMHHYGALLLAQSGAAPEAVMHELTLQAHVYDLGLIFFAINCLLTGVLLIRLPGGPNWIGAGIIASGAVYLTGSLARFLAPEWHGMVEPAYLVPLVAESAFCVWLLWRGGERGTAAGLAG